MKKISTKVRRIVVLATMFVFMACTTVFASIHYVDFIFYNRAIRVGFVHWACYLGWNSYNLFFYQTKKTN